MTKTDLINIFKKIDYSVLGWDMDFHFGIISECVPMKCNIHNFKFGKSVTRV